MVSSPLMMRKDYGDKESFVHKDPQTTQVDYQGVLESIKSNPGLLSALNEAVEKSEGNTAVMERVIQGIYDTLRPEGQVIKEKPAPIRTMWAALDDIADSLESAGMKKYAREIDEISDALEAADLNHGLKQEI